MRHHLVAVAAVAGLLVSGSLAAAQSTPTAEQADSAYATAVRETPGLVAYWRLGETNGDRAADLSGEGHEGTYAPAAEQGAQGLISGDSNLAVRLPGEPEGWVDAGDVLDFPGLAPFSVEAWVGPAPFRVPYPRLVQKEAADANSRRQGYLLYMSEETGRLGFERWRDGEADVAITPDALPIDAVTHVVATYDGGVMRLYIDGTPVTEGPSRRELLDTDFTFRIGGRSDDASPFSGIIDEVAIYDRALSEEEITAHFDLGTEGGKVLLPDSPPAPRSTPAPAPTQPPAPAAAATPAALPTTAPVATRANPTATPEAEPVETPEGEADDETVPTPEATGATTTAVTTDILNLRAGPSTDTVIITEIPAGSAVTVLPEDPVDGFVSVIWDGEPGWVSSDYLDFGAAPVIDPNSP
jgi:hypothetical protein